MKKKKMVYVRKKCLKENFVWFFTYRLHLRTITIIIAPNIADITETIINVKAHPSSPAASEIKQNEKTNKKMVILYYYVVCNTRIHIRSQYTRPIIINII